MSFIRQLLIFGVFGAASRLAAVVLVPLYTRTLSMDQYGQLELLLAIHALLVLLAGLQTESAIARDYYDARAGGTTGQLVWGAFAISTGGTLAVCLVMLGLWSAGVWVGTADLLELMLLLALTLPAQLLGIQLVILRFEGHAVRFALTSFLDLTLSAAFSAYFMVRLHMDLRGALLGLLLSKLICMSLVWPLTLGRGAPAEAVVSGVPAILRYGVPAMPAVLISWLQNAGSRLLLALALTLSDVAIAAVAIKVAAIYAFAVYSFRLAWEPYSMAKLGQVAVDPSIYNRALEWYVATMFLAAGIAVLLSPLVVQLLAPGEYAAAAPVANFFVLGQFWVGVTTVLVVGIHGSRRTWLLLPVYGWGVLLNCVLLLALAPLWGALSAGVAFLLGSMATAALACRYSNKHFNTGFSVALLCWTAAATLVFGIGVHQLGLHVVAQAGPRGVLLGNALALVMLGALLALIMRNSFARGHATELWHVINEWVRRRQSQS
jgi:O-antigen/teichoic acid export membrane protein